MDRNLVIVAGIISALMIGAGAISVAVSAHMFDSDHNIYNTQDPEFQDHYREMLDVHKQYFNNEISFEEFVDKMESEDFHGADFGCHGGFGMMGSYMMGWR